MIRSAGGRLILPVLAALGLLAARPAFAARPVEVAIFAITDLHGNLMPPPEGLAVPGAAGKTQKLAVGGVEYLASMIRDLRASHRNSIFVAAGDLVGASPLLSAMFKDQPTIQSLSRIGLEVSAVGNHEFDKGPEALLGQQKAASFHYLAANVVVKATGKTLFPAFFVKTFQGVPVAFIGAGMTDTPAMVAAHSVNGLEFRDEVESVNTLVPGLHARGIKAIVLLIHEGGSADGDIDGCTNLSGPIVGIASRLNKSVRVVVSGHTHKAYNCRLDGRVVTGAASFGKLVTEIDLKLDPASHDVIAVQARNLPVRDDQLRKDAGQSALLARYVAVAERVGAKVVGRVTQTLTRDENQAGESAVGEIVADAELAASPGSQIAFVNNGGLRANFVPPTVTHADAFAVQPFGDRLVTLSLTGAQVKTMLEQQWARATPAQLQSSKGFFFTWDAARPAGSRIVSVMFNGKAIDPHASYRVTLPDIIADGGVGFEVLKQGRDRQVGQDCLTATEAFLTAHQPLVPPPLDRIRRLH